MIIQLYKPLERRSDTFTLYNLVDFAAAEEIIDDPPHWRDIIENDLKPTWKKVKELRHNFYAHVNQEKSPKQILLETNLNPTTDCRLLLDCYDSFLAKMYGRLGRRQTPAKVKAELIRTEMKTMVDALKTHARSLGETE